MLPLTVLTFAAIVLGKHPVIIFQMVSVVAFVLADYSLHVQRLRLLVGLMLTLAVISLVVQDNYGAGAVYIVLIMHVAVAMALLGIEQCVMVNMLASLTEF